MAKKKTGPKPKPPADLAVRLSGTVYRQHIEALDAVAAHLETTRSHALRHMITVAARAEGYI